MVDPARCLEPESIAAFVRGRLDDAAARALLAHVERCPSCRQLLSAAVTVDGAGAAASGAPTAGAPPAGLPAELELGEGARVGRYVVLGRLGAGGMGVVYTAQDPDLQRLVALKLLRTEAVSPAERRSLSERLRREAQAMAQLQHPNVVAVHDVGSFGEHIFVAMELVEGRTLAAWRHERPRRWREIVDVFVAAGRGLAAAHAAGLVHCDFKPDNVLVGSDGRVRVSDFGLARPADNGAGVAASGSATAAALPTAVTVTGALVGTPFYMSPEQFLGTGTDARSDQFSFCVAVYAALTGEHPYAVDGEGGLPLAVAQGRLRPPAYRHRLPRPLRRPLARGLAHAPAARYPSMDALLRTQLRRAAQPHDALPRADRTLAPAARPLRRGAARGAAQPREPGGQVRPRRLGDAHGAGDPGGDRRGVAAAGARGGAARARLRAVRDACRRRRGRACRGRVLSGTRARRQRARRDAGARAGDGGAAADGARRAHRRSTR